MANNTITINLSLFERNFLIYLSERYGESNLNHKGISEDAQKALDRLASKGAVSRIILIGSPDTYRYTLTSMGTNLVDLIKEQSNG